MFWLVGVVFVMLVLFFFIEWCLDFGDVCVLVDVISVVVWVVCVVDNGDCVFVVVDKWCVWVYVFVFIGKLLGISLVLFGYVVGDFFVVGIGNKVIVDIKL